MGNKGLKTRTAISNAVNTELLNKLKDYSKESKIPMSKLLDEAIELLLEKREVN